MDTKGVSGTGRNKCFLLKGPLFQEHPEVREKTLFGLTNRQEEEMEMLPWPHHLYIVLHMFLVKEYLPPQERTWFVEDINRLLVHG